MEKEQLKDLNSLKKYQEYWALKKSLEDFCSELDNISDLDIHDYKTRLDLVEEIAGRRIASVKIKDFLSKLGLVEQISTKKIDKTGE